MSVIKLRADHRSRYAAMQPPHSIANLYRPIDIRALRIGSLLMVVALIYINFVPFRYRAVPFDQAVEGFRHLTLQNLLVLDRGRWFSNLLQFLPFGFFTCGAFRRRYLAIGVVLSAFLGVALASAIEFGQIWAAPRTVALDDIVAESIGSTIGVLIWTVAGPRIIQTLRVALSSGPGAVVAGLYLYLTAYVVVFLQPFDFLVTPEEIGAHIAHGIIDWRPLPDFNAWSVTAGLAKILLMVPMGAVVALVWRRGPVFCATGAVALSYIVEVVKVFEGSATVHPFDIAYSAAGALLGQRLIAATRAVNLNVAPLMRRAAWITAPFYLLALMFVRDWRFSLADFDHVAAVVRSLSWIPLYYDYGAPSDQAAFESVVGIGAIFAPVGVLVWATRLEQQGQSGYGPVLLSAISAAVLCAVIETGRLLTMGGRPDPTNLIIAAVAAITAQRICEWGAKVLPDLLYPAGTVK